LRFFGFEPTIQEWTRQQYERHQKDSAGATPATSKAVERIEGQLHCSVELHATATTTQTNLAATVHLCTAA
jgi:hypothetical protein